MILRVGLFFLTLLFFFSEGACGKTERREVVEGVFENLGYSKKEVFLISEGIQVKGNKVYFYVRSVSRKIKLDGGASFTRKNISIIRNRFAQEGFTTVFACILESDKMFRDESNRVGDIAVALGFHKVHIIEGGDGVSFDKVHK